MVFVLLWQCDVVSIVSTFAAAISQTEQVFLFKEHALADQNL
jgi:hypothetical protein